MIEHPRMAAAIGALTGLATLGGVTYGVAAWVDDRYAHAGAVQALQQQTAVNQAQTQKQLEINRLAGEIVGLTLRKQGLQDRIYDLSARPGVRTSYEAAMIQRYDADLQSVDRDIRARERMIHELRTGAR